MWMRLLDGVVVLLITGDQPRKNGALLPLLQTGRQAIKQTINYHQIALSFALNSTFTCLF